MNDSKKQPHRNGTNKYRQERIGDPKVGCRIEHLRCEKYNNPQKEIGYGPKKHLCNKRTD